MPAPVSRPEGGPSVQVVPPRLSLPLGRCAALILAVAVLLWLVPPRQAAAFTDVAGTPYAEAVGRLAFLGIVRGTGPTVFAPHEPLTRAQFAAFIVRGLGRPLPEPKAMPFSDVPSNHWAAAHISLARALGLTLAKGSFRPDEWITVAEAAAMLVRALGHRDVDVARLGGWPDGYMAKAHELGLLARVSARVPTAYLTRGEGALLVRALIDKR